MTLWVIVGVAVVGAFFGAVWPPGIGIVAIAALVAFFVILPDGADAMNEPNNFGQGLTAVIAAVFVLPAALGVAVLIGSAASVSDDMTYGECMADSRTSYEECQELR